MLRRYRYLILPVLVLVLLIAAGVLSFFWWRGAFLPRWITWNERVEASDDRTDGVVESVVLKEHKLIVYSSGSEVYRAPSSYHVQEAIWTDINGDGIKEVVMLYWRRGADGAESEGLAQEKGFGFTQHIAVFDGAERGMNELWDSAALTEHAEAMRFDTGRLIINASEGRQTLWMWDGEQLVPAR